MQYRTTEESQSLIKQWVSEWGYYLGVNQQWHISLALVVPGKLESSVSAAETTWATGYHTARIKFNKKELNQQTKEELEAIVVHELCHLVFAESFDAIDTLFGKGTVRDTLTTGEERNVDILSRFLVRSKYEKFPPFASSPCEEQFNADDISWTDSKESSKKQPAAFDSPDDIEWTVTS